VASVETSAETLAATAAQVDHANRRRAWIRRRLLALADLLAGLVFAIGLALVGVPREQAVAAAVLAPVWLLLAKLFGLYDRDHRAFHTSTLDEMATLAGWGLAGAGTVTILATLVTDTTTNIDLLAWPWVAAVATAIVLRASIRFAWRLVTPRERTLVAGTGELVNTVHRKIALLPQLHQEVVGTCTLPELERALAHGGPSVPVDRIVVTSRTLDEAQLATIVEYCRAHGTKLSVVPPVAALLGGARQMSHVADVPVFDYNTWDPSRSTLLLKRTLDLVVASTALVLAAPLMVGIAIAVKLDAPGPVLFRQQRVGRGRREFRILKFRTMVEDAEARLADVVPLNGLVEPVFKLRRDPRATRVGRRLRRLSLDELPQLWNVLRGDMSLVGPRPEQVELVARYGPDQDVRFRVRPGMTGPMQVYGRGNLDLAERLAVEREYVENLSLRRDLHLLMLTLPAVLSGRGAY
jgi:exopolysaccharide biosynthesis polyprenyl glycosylphosphotransferase